MKVKCVDFYGKDHAVDASVLINRLSAYGIYITDAKVLLIQDSRSLRWELPGGGVEAGETPKQALVREFKEETGVAPIGHFIFLADWEEYFFDIVDQQAWRSKRRFYTIGRINQEQKLLLKGNGEDSARVALVPIQKLDAIHVAPRIRELITRSLTTLRKVSY